MRSWLLIVLISISGAIAAQEIQRPESYNYLRGQEALENNNLEEGITYLEKEIAENPENGYAYLYLGGVKLGLETYGEALSALNKAIRYVPDADKEYKFYAFLFRAMTYNRLEQKEEALGDFSAAIAMDSTNLKGYEERGDFYYQNERYDLSDADYRKLIALDEGNVLGYMGIGRNAIAEKRYRDAIEQFDYVLKLNPEYSLGYSFRAESYMELGEYDHAIDDILKALSIDGDDKAFYCMQFVADSAFSQLSTRLKVQMRKEPDERYWPYCLGIIYERKHQYKQALPYYKATYAEDADPVIGERIVDCLSGLGAYQQALGYVEEAIREDSISHNWSWQKADLLDKLGKNEEAIQALTSYIERNPDEPYGYANRAWIKEFSNDKEGALEDYETAIVLEPEFTPLYHIRKGVLLKRKGKEADARKEFERVLESDTVPDESSCAHYAYFYLGRVDEARRWMEKILERANDKGSDYDAACLYALLGECERAIQCLRNALEKGYRDFVHIQRDTDLDNLRELPAFKALLAEYAGIYQKELEGLREDSIGREYIEKVSEIPFTKEGDAYKVPCEINELPLHFIFDTGASDLSLSTVEATFMLKNDYLKKRDILGTQNYMTADGEIKEGTVINIRNVSFGDLNLNNVKASVVKSQRAPLLLGQSVLNRLGKIEIDNKKKVLRISYKAEK